MSDADNEGLDFRIRRDDWSRCEFVTNEVSLDPPAGGVLFRVDRFALTANNITYAVAGDMLDYWGFFPADEGWGRIPVMGFADVLASSHPAVAVGERVFGFFPMSRHLLIEAEREGESVIIDARHTVRPTRCSTGSTRPWPRTPCTRSLAGPSVKMR